MEIAPIPVSPPIYFSFANPTAFSGQKAATVLVVQGLAERGWDCHLLPQPVLEREDGSLLTRFSSYVIQLAGSWLGALRIFGSERAILHVSLGQTIASFVRDSVPIAFACLCRHPIYIALNGGLFMRWSGGSLEARLFRLLCRQASGVIVLGSRQRARLIELGVDEERAKVIPNTCSPPSNSGPEFAADDDVPTDDVVRVLYLSSLIASKGYPEFLESLLRIGQMKKLRIYSTLCGQVVPSEFDGRFRSEREATDWIESLIQSINQTEFVQIRWVRGAVGETKAMLYGNADVFVLPTRYPVEAQPLVLLEAMASRCAIVSSRAGEIETVLDEESAVLLDEVSVDEVTRAICALVGDDDRRQRLSVNAYNRYVEHFALDRHLDLWEACLGSTDGTTESCDQGSRQTI